MVSRDLGPSLCANLAAGGAIPNAGWKEDCASLLVNTAAGGTATSNALGGVGTFLLIPVRGAAEGAAGSCRGGGSPSLLGSATNGGTVLCGCWEVVDAVCFRLGLSELTGLVDDWPDFGPLLLLPKPDKGSEGC